ncbi:ArsR/SmtB family transcription factor [Streptomyces acidiscabies]|uniref:ArsR family transcriptional regulator n=1 Tax=Streptomyces acidiscabies TaxID=42234 RepID=A0AAP6EDX2_9ACTN|nr:ArsR family transcriptional regulator [Streptomyces acidiscabies]MBP5939899.1 winged helix-turn-helix transcriptional regulator [Streptomyces sp. LBUM 1476]MBZ3911085.1 winged helix-turn-helix transcriptional regulator [Streptomyces acidiscabies]MDX2959134.1 ArsR family transcriptional regulator [Streptomyces acidiscabies]MDX3025742.1 ArsR family transcriptional regulator [Streptomyces acidiscabies]MDX3788197.1 ArsR family transcriptional regulator [Streptomyces acidiscabies]
MTTYSQLCLGDVSEIRMQFVPHPGASLLSLTADLYGDRRHAVPPAARDAVRREVPAHVRETLRPLFAPGHPAIPDCLTPTASMSRDGAEHHLEQLLDLPADRLLAALEEEFAGAPPEQWRPVVDRPGRWLERYGAVMRALWEAVRPVWRAAQEGLRREAERVGGAMVLGRPDTVLATLSPRYRYTDSVLHLPDGHPERFALDGRRIILVPVVSGGSASLFAFDHPDFAWVGYPLPGLRSLWSPTASPAPSPSPTDPARLLLGDARSAILRATTRPTAMGDLATALRYAPATLSHHCARLENAGLLQRRREGQYVVVHRSTLGSELLDLLSA